MPRGKGNRGQAKLRYFSPADSKRKGKEEEEEEQEGEREGEEVASLRHLRRALESVHVSEDGVLQVDDVASWFPGRAVMDEEQVARVSSAVLAAGELVDEELSTLLAQAAAAGSSREEVEEYRTRMTEAVSSELAALVEVLRARFALEVSKGNAARDLSSSLGAVEEAEARNTVLKNEVAAAQKQAAAAKAQLAPLQKQTAALEASNVKAQEELATCSRAIREEEARLAALKSDVAAAENKAKATREELAPLRAQDAALKEQLALVQKRGATIDAETAKLRARVREQAAALEKGQAELAKKEAKLKQQQQQLQKKKKKKVTLKLDMDALEAKKATASDVGNLKTVRLNSSASSSTPPVPSTPSSEEIRLREMVQELQEEIEIMGQRHENSRKITSVTGQEKKVHDAMLRSLEQENAELKTQLQEQQKRHDIERRVAAKRSAELMTEGIELQKQVRGLKAELADVTPSPIRARGGDSSHNMSASIEGEERVALRSMLEMMQTTLAIEKHRLHSRIVSSEKANASF